MPPQSLAETVAFGRRMAGQNAAAVPSRSAPRVLNKANLVVLGGLLVGSLAFLGSSLKPEPARALAVSVGQTRLQVSSTLVRNPDQAKDGPTLRLDLAVNWPDLQPVPRFAAVPVNGAPSGLGDTILVTLLPADDSPAPENRPALLYGRFLDGSVAEGPGGMILRRFRDGSPYEGEDLYLSPPDGRRFAARCEAQRRVAEGLPMICISEFRRHGLDVQIRLEPRLLEHWDTLAERLSAAIDEMVH